MFSKGPCGGGQIALGSGTDVGAGCGVASSQEDRTARKLSHQLQIRSHSRSAAAPIRHAQPECVHRVVKWAAAGGEPERTFVSDRHASAAVFFMALLAYGEKPPCHEISHAFLHCDEVIGVATPAGKFVDASSTRQRVHERASCEMVAPEDVL